MFDLFDIFGFKRRRRARLAAGPFPEAWAAILEKNMPLYARLSAADREELQRHILIFMNEKRFDGCGGLEITDEIRVTIAAQACLLLMHRKTDYYPSLRSILVYPHSYISRMRSLAADGVVTEEESVCLGESWHRGSVVLSWDDVRAGAADIRDGHNVVFHEFAHQLEDAMGRGDDTPVFESRSSFIAFARVLQKDYEKLRRDISRRRKTFLNEYGATNPAEFFAVATEYFFEKPKKLKKVHPDLYDELKRFYQQDPAGFS